MNRMFRALACCLLASCGFQVTGVAAGDDVAGDGRLDDAAVVNDGVVNDGRVIDAAIDAPAPPIDAPPPMIDAPPPMPVTANFPITQDTYVDSLNQTTTMGGRTEMLVDGGGQRSTVLWRADLSAIPTTATVTAAELHIWTSDNIGGGSTVYQVLEAWDEATAHWTRRSTGTNWSAAGASPPSRGTTAQGTITVSAQFTEYTVALTSALVAGWVTNPAQNYGAAIVTTSSSGTEFRTREDATASRRPYLRITYVP